MTAHTDWTSPVWGSLYTYPDAAPQPAPQHASPAQPAYLDILQQAAQHNVPLSSITLAGIDATAHNLDRA